MPKKADSFLLPFLYGFATLGFQILFVRRLISLCGSSEIGYAIIVTIWLLLTGLGAFLCERFLACRRARYLALALYGLLAMFLYGAIPVIYRMWGLGPGEITGFFILAATAFLSLLPLCLFSGGLFVGIVHEIASHGNERNLPFVYIVESLGGLVAGVTLTFVFLHFFTDRLIALGFFFLLAIIMMIRTDHRWLFSPPLITIAIMCLFGGAAFVMADFGHEFGNQNLLARMDTPYQHLAATEYFGQYTVYSNGHRFFSYPQAAEAEVLHTVLWQRATAGRIALIGLCPPDRLRELLKYQTAQIDLYLQDEKSFGFLAAELPPVVTRIFGEPRINCVWGDPYAHLPQSGKKYDFIFINYESPLDAVSNRFYTLDFYRLAKRVLTDSGILAITVPAGANLARPEIKEYLKMIYNSLRVAFARVEIIPADDPIFVATMNDNLLPFDLNRLLESKRKNSIATDLVDSVYLFYLFDPLRLQKYDFVYEPWATMPAGGSGLAINTISRPVVYYFNSVLWAERVSKAEKKLFVFWRAHANFLYLILLIPLLTLFALPIKTGRAAFYALCFLAGLSGMALEILLLILYQVYLGNIYSQIGLLVALFMFGLAAGGFLPYRAKTEEIKAKRWLYPGALVGGMLLLGLCLSVRVIEARAVQGILLLILAFLAGGFSGLLFNLSAILYGLQSGLEKPGKFYLTDLAGSALAGFLISTLIIPLLGFGAVIFLFAAILVAYIILHLRILRRA